MVARFVEELPGYMMLFLLRVGVYPRDVILAILWDSGVYRSDSDTCRDQRRPGKTLSDR